ncbi:hypothetical protein ATERTT37_004427 [Aspergillus terreus]
MSDWKEDIDDGLVFRSTKAEIYGSSPLVGEYRKPQSWPVSSDQVLVLTDGEPPREGYKLRPNSNEIYQPRKPDAAIDPRWIRVRNISEVDNIYDLGFWNNLRHAFGWPISRKLAHD